MRRTRLFWLLALLGASLGSGGLPAAEQRPVSPPSGTLQLEGGDRIAGRFCDCNQPDTLRWQNGAFTTPFDFDLAVVSMVHFPLQADDMKATGDYSFELSGGDILFGSLLGLTEKEVRVETASFGVLHLQRKLVRCISRWNDGADLVYLGPVGGPSKGAENETVYKGPNGLQEWEREHPHGAWHQEADFLTTEKVGALLARNFNLPAQASIEFELSWEGQPDFVFAMGAGRHGYEQAFRLEVWDDELVLLREAETEADLASLGKITTGPGRCHLIVYLDQQHNRAAVFSPAGKLLADLSVPESKSDPQSCIRLANYRGKLRLELLRVMHWNGVLPHDAESDKPRVQRTDGSVVYGDLQEVDPTTGEFVLNHDDQPTRIPRDQVACVVLPFSDVKPSSGVRAILQDGTRIRGVFQKLADNCLWLDNPGVAEPLRIPVAELKTLLSLVEDRPSPDTDGRVGRLVLENVSIEGRLVPGDPQSGGSCLAWQPLASKNASSFAAGASAKVVYRTPPPTASQPRTQTTRTVRPQRAQVVGGGVIGVLAGAFGGNSASRPVPALPAPTARPEPCLYLRTGDAIPCEVERIDQRGVTFHSPSFEATFASHDKIKAVELENRSVATKVDPSSRDRLITLPRMQKDNPPTHLIRSVHGDYLRARLLEMDDETLTVEVRLDTRKIPRNQVTRIIWLGDVAGDQPLVAPEQEDAVSRLRVQTLRSDGLRFTFSAEKLDDKFLEGASDVLGVCRVDLDEVDQLAIGAAIEQEVADLPYQRWKLRDARLPRFAEDDTSTPGTESALVGEPAPDFVLKSLDGSEFRLRDHRGKVVVLEFWASWCGPCVDTLPRICRTIQEMQDPRVLLAAVNLQETPEAVHAILERLEVEPTVLLDQAGTVAQQYAAVAIPQTVIVDAEGNVARLFVGGGRGYEEQLREALQVVLKANSETSASGE